MGSDSSIYGLIRQPTIEPLQSPEEREAKRMTLRNLAIQGEGAALGLQEKRDEIGTRRRLQDFISANPNATADQIAPIDYRAAAAMRKEQLEAEGKRATIGHTNAQAGNINAGHIAGAFAALAKGGGSDASVQAARDVLAQTVGPERAAQTMAPLLGMPPELRLAYAVQAAGMHKVGQEAIGIFFPKAELKDTGGAIVPVSTSTIPGGAAAGSVLPGAMPIQKTATPGELLTDKRGWATLAETRAEHGRVAERARATAGAGKIPPGYRATADGNLEAIPGGPADQKDTKKADEIRKTVDMYVAAREGLMSGLEGSTTGPIVGRMTPLTADQQIAEGGAASMIPVLKQLFRVAGEGVFTDKDQENLINMVPSRKTEPAARKAQIENIDRIVAAKLGAPVPTRTTPQPKPRAAGKEPPLGGGRGKFLGFE